MSISKFRLGLIIAVTASGFASAPALAKGCNGVVEWWTWGCAGWDNNNGPNFKYYRKTAVPVTAKVVPVKIENGEAYAVVNGQKAPIVGSTAGLVAAGGGNIVAQGGGNLVAAGGGNLKVWSSN